MDNKNNPQLLTRQGLTALLLMRLFSLSCVVLLFFIGYDLVMPATNEATAVFLEETRAPDGDWGITVEEGGRRKFRQGGGLVISALQIRDELRVKKSRFFGNWKQVSVVRNGLVVMAMKNIEDFEMSFLGLFLFIPFLSFFIGRQEPAFIFIARHQPILYIVIPVIETFAVFLLAHILLTRLGLNW